MLSIDKHGEWKIYVILKDKTINGNRINVYRHPKYTDDQIVANESDINADYIELNKEED